MARPKKRDTDKETIQFNIRMPKALVARLDSAADALGTDRSHLLRMVLAEALPGLEERARRVRGGADE
jgi:hypothetical protein